MKKIASFSVNHDLVTRGMFISRIDGDVVTYDIRMKTPNGGEYLSYAGIHTFEHLFATYVRNSVHGDKIIYVGPMGCRTGFYFLVRDTLSHADALTLMQETLRFIAGYEGEIPGAARIECGNYLEHSLTDARQMAKEMSAVLKDWSPARMQYQETELVSK